MTTPRDLHNKGKGDDRDYASEIPHGPVNSNLDEPYPDNPHNVESSHSSKNRVPADYKPEGGHKTEEIDDGGALCQ